MTTANPALPENRIFFDPVHETAVNDFYNVMRESNANLESMITYLRTTNTSITSNSAGQVGQGQPGAVTEALMNTVKKLRDENKEVENKWSAYMALRGGVITHSNVPTLARRDGGSPAARAVHVWTLWSWRPCPQCAGRCGRCGGLMVDGGRSRQRFCAVMKAAGGTFCRPQGMTPPPSARATRYSRSMSGVCSRRGSMAPPP